MGRPVLVSTGKPKASPARSVLFVVSSLMAGISLGCSQSPSVSRMNGCYFWKNGNPA